MTVAVQHSVPQIIYQQLGGSKFSAMTGTTDFIGDGYTLEMRLQKNRSGANRLHITLDPHDDTYTMHFFKYTRMEFDIETFEIISGSKRETIKEINGVYADMLRDIFEGVTGMYTTL